MRKLLVAGMISENQENLGKYETPGSKWELYAKEMVLWKYPNHEIKFQTPTLRVDNTVAGGTIRADLSVYKDSKLIAVIEVGDLSRPDKLTLLRVILPPDVAVWWIPKTDLLSIIMPSLDDFRLAKHAREEVGIGLLSELFRERQEITELRKVMSEGLKFVRRFVGLVKTMRDQMSDVVQTLDDWEKRLEPIEIKENGIPDHDKLLDDLVKQQKNET